MSEDGGRRPRWRVLVDGDRVAVDPTGAIAPAPDDAGGFPLAPELLVEVDRTLLVDVREGSCDLDGRSWLPLSRARGPQPVLDAVRSAVRTYAGQDPLPPRRPEWFTAPWRGQVDEWVDARLADLGRRRAGPTTALKVWCISAVLTVPTDAGPLYFKAACDWFRTEARLTALLASIVPGSVPELVAHEPDRGWQLMAPLAGVSDEDEPTPGVAAPTASTAAGLHLDSLPHRAELLAAGCPDRGLESTLAAFRDVVAGSPELRFLDADERSAVSAMLPDLERSLAELAAYGVPETLLHGDLHLGNVAHADERLTVYDWSDACLGHPLVDLATLVRASPPDELEAVRAAYAEPWRSALPGLDLGPLLAPLLAEPRGPAMVAERAFQTVTYEGIQSGQEEASMWEFEGIVARSLRRLATSFGRLGA